MHFSFIARYLIDRNLICDSGDAVNHLNGGALLNDACSFRCRRDIPLRLTSGRLTRFMLSRALRRPTSRFLCGYWQGNKPPDLIWEGDPAGPG